MFWRDSVTILAPGGARHRLHARRLFHGRPRFDLVQVTGEAADQPWYGRLLALFDVCTAARTWKRMALVQWLERVHPSHVAGALTFSYWSDFPDAVCIGVIVRPMRMVTSPISEGDDDAPCFVLLPYGRVNV